MIKKIQILSWKQDAFFTKDYSAGVVLAELNLHYTDDKHHIVLEHIGSQTLADDSKNTYGVYLLNIFV